MTKPALCHMRTTKAQIICLFWGLTSHSTIFQSCRDGATASWVINQYFRGVKCLAQGHNTAEVGFEPPTSRSRIRHSTTEPPRSPKGADQRSLISTFVVRCLDSMSLVMRKPVFALREQQRRRSAWASPQSDQHFVVLFLDSIISQVFISEISSL